MQITKVMAILAIMTLPLAAQADTLSEDRVKELVLEAIRENPEIVLEAVQIIEQREQQRQAAAAASVLSDNRDVLENDPNAPVLGNPDGDVTVVEFPDAVMVNGVRHLHHYIHCPHLCENPCHIPKNNSDHP